MYLHGGGGNAAAAQEALLPHHSTAPVRSSAWVDVCVYVPRVLIGFSENTPVIQSTSRVNMRVCGALRLTGVPFRVHPRKGSGSPVWPFPPEKKSSC